MQYGERRNPIIFGGGQRSSGVTRGQTQKTLLTRYLKCLMVRGRTLLFLVEVKGHLGSPGVKLQKPC
ncbi:hypothetical protein HOLleu_08039 [Holothuria leucospilota]|uniref:Uncharacterized protein n=1 Tax=Holothuria leucospilota TaxID=206669 RepID=A0A9Q1CGX0_HOLLE|nr:hypothetical protein HOLleu_08039 [Holothuria leucospilota]